MEILNSDNLSTLSICADDFGYSSEINKTIIELIDKKIVTETSCLIYQSKYFTAEFNELKTRSRKINIGLHLLFLINNYKNIETLRNYKKTFRKYIINSHLNLIDKTKIKSLINYQLDLYEKVFENYPNFIDSHMHIHQFPNISDILLEALSNRYDSKTLNNIWIRNTSNNNLKKNNLKSKILSFYGRKFKKKMSKLSFNTNNNFIGSYNFTNNFNIKNYYKEIFKKNLDKSLLMVHPGTNNESNENIDEIYKFRQIEYNFLTSSDFRDLLHRNKIKIKKFKNNLF